MPRSLGEISIVRQESPHGAQRILHLFQVLRIQHSKHLLDLRARHALRARKVDDLAQLLELVELTCPVVTHDEDVHLVVADVAFLLRPFILRDDQIHTLDALDDGRAVLVGDDRLLPLARVELVSRDTDDEAVAECGEAIQQIEVSDVEQIKVP